MKKGQRLVNAIDARFGLDASRLSDEEIESLIDMLTDLMEHDREDLEEPYNEFYEEIEDVSCERAPSLKDGWEEYEAVDTVKYTGIKRSR